MRRAFNYTFRSRIVLSTIRFEVSPHLSYVLSLSLDLLSFTGQPEISILLWDGMDLKSKPNFTVSNYGNVHLVFSSSSSANFL